MDRLCEENCLLQCRESMYFEVKSHSVALISYVQRCNPCKVCSQFSPQGGVSPLWDGSCGWYSVFRLYDYPHNWVVLGGVVAGENRNRKMSFPSIHHYGDASVYGGYCILLPWLFCCSTYMVMYFCWFVYVIKLVYMHSREFCVFYAYVNTFIMMRTVMYNIIIIIASRTVTTPRV